MINIVTSVYSGEIVDITKGTTFYYSTKTQARLYERNYKRYPTAPNFIDDRVEMVKIRGIQNDDFSFLDSNQILMKQYRKIKVFKK